MNGEIGDVSREMGLREMGDVLDICIFLVYGHKFTVGIVHAKKVTDWCARGSAPHHRSGD